MSRIHLECLPDEHLVKFLGIARKDLKHHNDKGRVCRKLEGATKLTGLIDEDPFSAQPSYIEKLTLKEQKHHINVLKEKKRENTLIVLCPKLEDWLLYLAGESNIDVNDFGLPSDADKLHKIIHFNLDKVTKLLTQLKEAKSPGLLHLQQLLK